MRRDEFVPPAPHFPAGAAAPILSVVVPLYEEESIVPPLVARLGRALDDLGLDAEVILVDDGSADGTLAEIGRAHRADPRFVGLALSRNFGHQLAITAGLEHARGRAVVVMDGDLQDPPEAIGALWAKYREGYDVVYAVRASRPEGWCKRLAYRAYYRLLRRLVAVEIPLDAGDFGIMSRRVVDLLNAMPERRRFVRGLRAWVGFRQAGIPIGRSARHAGRPKYTLAKLSALALDGLIGFSTSLFHASAALGASSVLAALLGTAFGLARGMLGPGLPPVWAWFLMLFLFFGGAVLLFLAVIGEYVGRILHEVNGRPLYVVRRRIGVHPPRRGSGRGRARRRRERAADRPD